MSVLALTGAQKGGILAVAAVFIAFALISSFVLPRRNPDFPGRRGVVFFAIVSVALFVAMLTAMVTLAKEGEEEGGDSAVAGEIDTSEGEPSGGDDTTALETQPAGAAEGDPAAGKEIFASAGCTGCHTLQDAGATGNVGPNLDEAKPDYQLALDRVTNGAGAMPSFKENLSEKDIENVASYVVQATSG